MSLGQIIAGLLKPAAPVPKTAPVRPVLAARAPVAISKPTAVVKAAAVKAAVVKAAAVKAGAKPSVSIAAVSSGKDSTKMPIVYVIDPKTGRRVPRTVASSRTTQRKPPSAAQRATQRHAARRATATRRSTAKTKASPAALSAARAAGRAAAARSARALASKGTSGKAATGFIGGSLLTLLGKNGVKPGVKPGAKTGTGLFQMQLPARAGTSSSLPSMKLPTDMALNTGGAIPFTSGLPFSAELTQTATPAGVSTGFIPGTLQHAQQGSGSDSSLLAMAMQPPYGAQTAPGGGGSAGGGGEGSAAAAAEKGYPEDKGEDEELPDEDVDIAPAEGEEGEAEEEEPADDEEQEPADDEEQQEEAVEGYNFMRYYPTPYAPYYPDAGYGMGTAPKAQGGKSSISGSVGGAVACVFVGLLIGYALLAE